MTVCLVLCHKHSGQRQVPLLLWALPGPTPGSMWQRWHCRASRVTHVCQTSPPLPLMNFIYQKLHFCAWLTFMVGHGVSALESLKHGYFTHCLSKLPCLHLLTLDLDFPLSSPALVPNPHSVVKSQLTASVPLNLQAGQGHLFFAGPASPHSSVSPSL